MNNIPQHMQVLEKSASMLRARLDMQHALQFFSGHFPEMAILPGVTQLHWAILLAKHYWSPKSIFLSASRIKFQKPVQPFDVIDIELEYRGNGVFNYQYTCKNHAMSSGVFALAINDVTPE